MGRTTTYVVEAATQIAGGVTVPPGRYPGMVEWSEYKTFAGVERTPERFKFEIDADIVRAWGGEAGRNIAPNVYDVTAQIAAGEMREL